ncbi:hypothetical protein [Saccharothrix sp. NRRL B-16314]|uniref:hypothetical protein n=1 Tax=Saccharothrix sp. NRRL B-16314 TaxID=1463825 RepID=UPI000AF630AF|nr:hypothetical protein [Saccharothrix sp. NRRL B-16314]
MSGLLVAVFVLARAFGKTERRQHMRVPTLIAGLATVAAIIGLSFVGGGLGTRVGLTVWFARVALVSYQLFRVVQEGERGAASRAPVG